MSQLLGLRKVAWGRPQKLGVSTQTLPIQPPALFYRFEEKETPPPVMVSKLILVAFVNCAGAMMWRFTGTGEIEVLPGDTPTVEEMGSIDSW